MKVNAWTFHDDTLYELGCNLDCKTFFDLNCVRIGIIQPLLDIRLHLICATFQLMRVSLLTM